MAGYLVLKGTAWISLCILYHSLAAARELSAATGLSQAARAMQLSFSSSPPVYRRKDMPPVRSDWETLVCWSPALPVTPPPLTSPNTMMATMRAMRMMRLVRLRLMTSLLVLARLTTSSAVARKGASSAAARANMADPMRAERGREDMVGGEMSSDYSPC